MKKFYILTVFPLLIVFSGQTHSQGTGQPFQPVIAEGAKYIYKTDQVLRWKNPADVLFNEVYISPYLSLVENLDPSIRILNGYPNNVYSSAELDPIEPLQYDVKYFWRVVEYSSIDTAAGPVWYFETLSDLSQYNLFADDFDSYISGIQLACQNPLDWTTWNNLPCDPVEDPFVSQDYFYSDSNSFHIKYGNDLLKILDQYATLVHIISMMMYIPEGHSGYWNALQQLNPPYWGFEVYFNSDGTGSINAGGNNSASFSFLHNDWFKTSLIVDIMYDQAEFRIGNTSVYTWQWSLGAGGGSGINQLAAVDFYGFEPDCDYYVDNFSFNIGYILSPPTPPRNIQAEGVNNGDPEVVLSWLPGNNWGFETGYGVYRKDGLPTEPGNYVLLTDTLGTSTFNYTDTSVSALGVYTYKVYLAPSGPLGAEATAYVPEAIPVELISFTGSVTENGICLNWTTATEANNSGFEIQRSEIRDQSVRNTSEISVWDCIGFIEGNGTTVQMHSYRFLDKDVKPGKYSYRLKQIDFNGSHEYSNEVKVEVTTPSVFSLEQNYPNPFNPVTTIKYSVPRSTYSPLPGGERGGLVMLKIYNTLGEEVATLVNEQQPAGIYEVKFDGSKLPSGVYIYRLTSGSYTEAKKLILLK